MKLFNYELSVLKKFYEYCYLKKYESFQNFLNSFPFVYRELTGSGEYLTLKKNKDSIENNMNLCNLTIYVDTCCLDNGAEFILWHNSECIILEGYSYENKWLKPECEVRIR
jgi:hypothetical protein